MFINEAALATISWQGFERAVSRLLFHAGYEDVRVVGQTSDKGADIIAHKFGRRWLFQVKQWKARAGLQVVDATVQACVDYDAQIPVIVALNGFDANVRQQQIKLQAQGIPLQLWDRQVLLEKAHHLPLRASGFSPRSYQEMPIRAIFRAITEDHRNRGLVVMATGLGKTVVAAEALKQASQIRPARSIVLAHTNALVYQLERAFWKFLSPLQETAVWNEYERPDETTMLRAEYIFGCVNSVATHLANDGELPPHQVLLIDECHHAGTSMYTTIIDRTRAGQEGGPFLLGLTATPWRPDGNDLDAIFGEPLASVDMVTGLKNGFLAEIDYRLYVDNINWDALRNLKGAVFTPKGINRRIFITEWDDAVVLELKRAWTEQKNPRAIVFCGTIDHAITMRDRINALGFAYAAAIYSGTRGGRVQTGFERNRILSDFHDGRINIVCAVDIFNEGVDVPDVNIVVFQRVTHSRRIFVQQLGRGLRLSSGKEKVLVLDFVSDIRRFAAGLKLKDDLFDRTSLASDAPVRIKLNNKVSFRRVGGEDPQTESFLREWLDDIAAIEDADEDASILKFVPPIASER